MRAPAKINLFLAVTGRRPDGFHDLVSVVAPLDWGDELETGAAPDGPATLSCDDPEVPSGSDNLILKAAASFEGATGRPASVSFKLVKRIPMGAGLGGGSSNAAAALKLLNYRHGHPLDTPSLHALAAAVGSDCPLFLAGGPVVMRGRGERLSPLPGSAASRLAGRRVLLFRPGFAISTPWAYGWMASRAPASYLPAAEAEARLARWIDNPAFPAERLLFNSLEAPAFSKFPALPAVLSLVEKRHGLAARMSGSGSACFALLPEAWADLPALSDTLRGALGPSVFIAQARIGTSSQIPV